MALNPNVFSNLIPKLIELVAAELRANSVMPRLVSNYSDAVTAQRGSSIDIATEPVGITEGAVTAAVTPPEPAAITFPRVPLLLDQWREFAMAVTDREAGEIAGGLLPKAMQRGVIALAERIDRDILSLYKGVFNTGVSMPFEQDVVVPPAFVVEATDNPEPGIRAMKEARAKLNIEGVPMFPRRGVLSAEDEADVGALKTFLHADTRGDQEGILRGELGEKLGIQWFMNQQVPTHISGSLADEATEATNDAQINIGATSAAISGTIAATILKGDVFRFQGFNQTYTATADLTLDGSGDGTLNFSPAARDTIPQTTDLEFLLDHKVNLVFHPDAFAFASRPLGGVGSGSYEAVFDDVSGLSFRVEQVRAWGVDLLRVDVLYGFALVEPRLAARIASQA